MSATATAFPLGVLEELCPVLDLQPAELFNPPSSAADRAGVPSRPVGTLNYGTTVERQSDGATTRTVLSIGRSQSPNVISELPGLDGN